MNWYEQGRMDAWERIDAIKRRLGLASFFNEQKHKRYPKGHPKAGEFMPKPKEGKKPVVAKKILNLNLAPVETEIDGNKFSLRFYNSGNKVNIDFLANDNYEMQDLPDSTKKKAAFWWRRSAINTAKMMPDGVPLSAAAYMEDGKGRDRLDFYKALGFNDRGGYTVSAITRGGKVIPETEAQERSRRKVEIRTMNGGKPKRAYTEQDYNEDLDNIFGGSEDNTGFFSENPRPRSAQGRTAGYNSLNDDDNDIVFDFADDDDDDDIVFDFADDDDELPRPPRRGSN